MSGGASEELKIGGTVAGRFRVTESLPDGSSRPVYRGIEADSGRGVLLFALTAAEASALRPVVGLNHPHLASVLAVPEGGDGASVLVAEYVRGSTLRDVLSEVTHETPIEAARSVLRIADAVCAIHQAGGVHGCLRPAAFILAPEGHPPPRLTFAPPPVEGDPYRLPERGTDDPPSTAGDTWAVAVLLHETLVGRPPPARGITDDRDLVAAGLQDVELRAAIVAALAPDPEARASDLQELRRALARWFVTTSVESEEVPSEHSISHPPPLPPSVRLPASGSVAAKPGPSPTTSRIRTRVTVVGAGIVFLVAIALAWSVSLLWRGRVQVVEVSKAPVSASVSASAANIDLGEVPVTGDQGAATGDEMATCVAGYLPPGAFGEAPALSWICGERRAVEGAKRLSASIVSGRPKGQTTGAMKLWENLDWYEIAAYAVIRGGCCLEAPPLDLPPSSEGCGKLDVAAGRVGSDVGAGRSSAASLQEFTDAANCEAKAGRAGAFDQKGPPSDAARAAFLEYLRALEGP